MFDWLIKFNDYCVIVSIMLYILILTTVFDTMSIYSQIFVILALVYLFCKLPNALGRLIRGY